jgi:glucose-1-phosphatase
VPQQLFVNCSETARKWSVLTIPEYAYFRAMVKQIIFDLGGVLINLDFQATSDAFKKLGAANFDAAYTQLKQSEVFDRLDRGEISDEDFRNYLREFMPQSVSDEALDAAWNAMILDFPAARLQWLLELKERMPIYLLSNTNHIHVRHFSAYLKAAQGVNDLKTYFNRAYYSCEIGLRKPDVAAFEFVLQENNLLPHETLFIDDTHHHVAGALQAGLQATLLEKQQRVEDVVQQILH